MLYLGEKVNIQVDTVLPFGVFCHIIADGTRAYIRRRELTLQGIMDPRNIVKPGDLMDVVVLELATEGKIVELSRRKALPDPWVEFGHKAKVMDVVKGTVKYVGMDRVIIEVQPGVDGVVSVDDLSINRLQRPEEIVWPGDRIEATVIRMDPASHKLHLSIRHHAERRLLIGQFLGELSEQETSSSALPISPEEDISISCTALNYTGHILVAEDDLAVRTAITNWLEAGGCQVTACANGLEALEYFNRQEYALLFTDINMPAVDGVSLAKQIRQKYPKTIFVFISDPDHLCKNMSEIELLGGYIFTKPIDTEELHQFLEKLSTGDLPAQVRPYAIETVNPFHSFGMKVENMRSAAPLAERIELALAHLLRETGAEEAALFHYDPISRLINIVSQVGSLSLDETQVNSLVASPVEDVITEDIIIWENNLADGSHERFENLLRVISFKACIGISVRTGEERDHALFIFHSHPDVFSRYRVRDVQTTASLISVALEEYQFRGYVRDSSALILNGQLSSAFNHEIYNKISVLDFQLDILTSTYKSLQDLFPQIQAYAQAKQVNKSLGEVILAVSTIKNMADDFRQIMRGGSSQPKSVNQIVKQVCEQVKPAVARAGVTLTEELDSNLPDLRINHFALIYVVYNLLINAVQHLEKHPGERHVKVHTGMEPMITPKHTFIRVFDSGPGIHCQLWEKIFELGYTSRPGGSGLGLYIARSLIETLGGKIFVEESLISAGTIFRIEIPLEAPIQ